MTGSCTTSALYCLTQHKDSGPCACTGLACHRTSMMKDGTVWMTIAFPFSIQCAKQCFSRCACVCPTCSWPRRSCTTSSRQSWRSNSSRGHRRLQDKQAHPHPLQPQQDHRQQGLSVLAVLQLVPPAAGQLLKLACGTALHLQACCLERQLQQKCSRLLNDSGD